MESFLRADWPAPPGIVAGTTTRLGSGESAPPFDRFNLGSRTGDLPARVQENRRRLLSVLALPAAPHWLQQVHGVTVFRASGAPGPDEPLADAAVSDDPAAVLAVLTADCLPVLLCSRDGRHIGAAHAGWRGLAAGVLEATVSAMAVAPGNLMAWLGPAAGPTAYEVGDEVRAAFVAVDARADDAFVASRSGHWLVDLYRLARQRLAAAGVAEVHGGGLCTISDDRRFFSHRRDQRTGRMASLIWRRLD